MYIYYLSSYKTITVEFVLLFSNCPILSMFINSIVPSPILTYLYYKGLMNIYLTLWVIILLLSFNFFLNLFQVDHWRILQVGSCVLLTHPIIFF